MYGYASDAIGNEGASLTKGRPRYWGHGVLFNLKKRKTFIMPNLIQTGKRALTVAVVSSTIMWSMGVAALAPVGAATLANGDLIKASGPAVYYYMDAKRLPFSNDKVYKSWFVDFSKVKTITDAELAAIPLAGTNMTYRPGTRLVKITTDPKVYAVEPGGMLRWISSEAVAKDLLGENWNKQIDDVPDVFFTNYSKGADVTTSTPTEGSLVKTADSSDIYLVGAAGAKRKIDGFAAFSANGYQSQYVRTVASAISNALTTAAPVTGAEAALTAPKVAAAPAAVEPVGALTASLSGPVAGTLNSVASQALLMDVKLTGNGKITGVTLKRKGPSADATLSNVYLFDGTKRLTDGAAVATGGLVNFTNLDIAVTGSMTLSVKADMAGAAGEQVGIDLTDMKLSSGSVTGLPVMSNTHSVAVVALATVALGAATASGNADPGKDLLVWQSTATVSTRDVQFTRLALRQIGSINATDIRNFKLLLDGTEVASQESLDASGYVTFILDKKLTSGARILRVQADVTGGSGRTVQMSLRGAYDITVTDSQYSANAAATAAGGFPLAAAAWTVNAGTMTVVKAADSPSQNVTVGSSDVPLAKYTFTANGEKIKVETLRVGIITTTGTVTDHTLRNVRIMVNGAQVGSNTSVPAAPTFAAATGTSFTTNFYVTPGTPATVEIRADIFDNEGDNNATVAVAFTALQALLVGGIATSNAVPSVSLGTINVPSQTNVLGNTLGVASGSISLTQTANYGAQTIVVPQNAYKLASFNLVGNATEAVNINTFELDFTSGGGATFDASDDLTDLYIKYGDKITSTKATVTDIDDTWSVSFTLAKNETKTLEVYANIGGTVTATDTILTRLTVTGVTADSAVTVYADNDSTNTTKDATGFAGQTITANTGSITVSVDASRPNSALLDDAGNVPTAAFKFDAVNDSYTVTDLTLTLGNATAVRNVNLKDGATVVATRAANATVTFNGLSIAVAANTPKILTAELEMGPVGVGMGTTGSAVLTTLTSATARNSQGTSAAVTEATADPAGQATYAYKSIPTLTTVALPTATLVGGGASHTLAKFTLGTGSTGTVGWAKLLFTVNKNIAGTDAITAPTLWDVTSGATQVSGTAVLTTLTDGSTSGSITFVPNAEQQVSGAKTYELRATVTGSPVAGDSVTTQITQPSGFLTSVAAYAINTLSAVTYYDTDAGGTVTAGDVRQVAQDRVLATAGAITGTVTANATGLVTSRFSSALTEPASITLNKATAAWTVSAGTGWTTATVAGGNDTTFPTSVTSATGEVITLTGGTATTGAGTAVITLTRTVGGYIVGSIAVATDSDLTLALAGGVLPAASFVWSDLSASSHSLTTSDWTNGFLVKNLPTDTQNLIK